MKTNYILVDFENVQPSEQINLSSNLSCKVLMFIGERQKNLSINLVATLPKNVEYIRIVGNGRNALDFHIAYWIGKLSERDSHSHFHIISKDKGYDPLVKYLCKKGILAERVATISDVLISNKDTPAEKLASVATSLKSWGSSRPRKRTTLKNRLLNHFGNKVDAKAIDKIIAGLERKKYITFKNDAVIYDLEKVK